MRRHANRSRKAPRPLHDQLDIASDDTHAVTNAGLLLAATLAERPGIQQAAYYSSDLALIGRVPARWPGTGRQLTASWGAEGAVLEADEAADIQEVQAWAAGLDALHARIAGRFGRAEPRRRALAYLRGLLGNVGRKNGWQLAEHAGERTPDGRQRLLATADWDPDRVRDDLRGYVVEHLGDAGAVLVVDETGFLKKGTTSVGVQRQYSGHGRQGRQLPAGGVPGLCQPQGAGDDRRELYLPASWTDDPLRRRAARVPEQVAFRTKPQLAQLMLERALDAGVAAAWVTADEVYGGSPALRGWLEGRGLWHVLAVSAPSCWKSPVPMGWCAPAPRSWPLGCRPPSGSPAAPATAPRAAGCTTGPGWRWPPRPPPPWPGGCWGAAAATAGWPFTPATARPPRRWSGWSGWPGPGGGGGGLRAGQGRGRPGPRRGA
jgi:hypothetical protein